MPRPCQDLEQLAVYLDDRVADMQWEELRSQVLATGAALPAAAGAVTVGFCIFGETPPTLVACIAGIAALIGGGTVSASQLANEELVETAREEMEAVRDRVVDAKWDCKIGEPHPSAADLAAEVDIVLGNIYELREKLEEQADELEQLADDVDAGIADCQGECDHSEDWDRESNDFLDAGQGTAEDEDVNTILDEPISL